MSTTISPGLGHSPLFTQQGVGTTPGYDAIDDRRAAAAGRQEGVMDTHSFEVTQDTGSNLNVKIAASTADAQGSGVAALVQGDAATFQGLYPIPPHSAVITEVIATANGSLPRVDMVVLEVLDNVHDSSGSNLARTRVITGTPTTGATLNNRTGAAALPNSCLLLADVLVGAGATAVTNAAIRDRRKWARGAYCRIIRNGGSYTITSASLALIDGTNLAPRIECSGVPLQINLYAEVNISAGSFVSVIPQIDSVGMDGMTSAGSVPFGASREFFVSTTSDQLPALQWVTVPTAGSHIIAPAWACQSSTATAYATSARPLIWEVRELLTQNTANNSVTTG